jgi:iron complex outermembrane recepter protein
LPRLEVVPDVDLESKRWLQSAINNLVYYQGGSFTLVSLNAAYNPIDPLKVELGVTNLMDRDYAIEDGYNGPGREYFLNVRVNF